MATRALRVLVPVLLSGALASSSFATELRVVRIGDPDPEFPANQHPTVAVTDEGFAALWVSDAWVPLRTFRRFSEDGAPLSGPREIDDSDRRGSVRADHRMLATSNGFVAYARRGGLWAVALGLDDTGAPTGPEHVLFEVKDDQEILELSAARNGNSLTTVRVQWAVVGSLVAERTDRTGRPVGPERPIVIGGSDGWFSTVRAAPVAALDSGFVTAWVTDSETVRFRELSRTGAPEGDVVELTETTEGCVGDVHLATSAGRVAVVTVEGCVQLDIVARSRRPDGTWSTPYPVADAPFDEGPYWLPATRRGVRVVGAGDRFGVLYATLPDGRRAPPRWNFVEVGFDGVALGPPVDLLDAIAMDPAGEVDLVWDEARGRYLFAWAGGGPEGPGVYVALRPAEPR